MQKILTISIAAYNVEDYLDNTLDSLVTDSETMDKLEIIVVDDGSKDNTKNIANKYAEKYPNTFKVISKENGGYGSTINASLEIATGRYFKQLDGDDWYDKEALKKFIKYLQEVNSDIVITPYVVVDVEKNTQEVEWMFEELPKSESSIESVEYPKLIRMHEIAIKTSIIKDNDIFITPKCFYTDTEYVNKPLYYAKTISCFDKPIYYYRLGVEGQSVSNAGYIKHYEDLEYERHMMYELYIKALNEIEGFKGSKKESLYLKQVRNITDTSYYVCHLIDSDFKKKLIQKEKELKSLSDRLYQEVGKVKKIKILRFGNYILLNLKRKIIYK